ncbi:MAG TPA: rubrerythrin [Phycisphaerales bacterium]|nr:rubrerythrin [Phycisphaerales bacterium]
MTVTFNAFEVFEIAEQIERNGTDFYIRAAELFDDPDICQMFLRLAEWEREHELIFAGMKQQLSEQSRQAGNSGPDDLLPDPRVMAGLAVFGMRSYPAEELRGRQEKTDIIRRAVEKEKDSIVFYHGLKEFVPAGADKEKIDDIIKEEMGHIVTLDQSLKQYD